MTREIDGFFKAERPKVVITQADIIDTIPVPNGSNTGPIETVFVFVRKPFTPFAVECKKNNEPCYREVMNRPRN